MPSRYKRWIATITYANGHVEQLPLWAAFSTTAIRYMAQNLGSNMQRDAVTITVQLAASQHEGGPL